MVVSVILSEITAIPPYIQLLLSFVGMVLVLVMGFTVAGKQWMKWAYTNVADVRELKEGQMLSGFGGWSIEKMIEKHPEEFENIALRLQEYKFVDDTAIGSNTVLKNRKLYQRPRCYIFLLFSTSTAPAIFTEPDAKALYIGWTAVLIVLIIREYRKSVRAYPNLILTDEMVRYNDTDYDWRYITNEMINRRRYSINLCFSYHDNPVDLRVDELNSAAGHLHHLLYVYRQRHEQKKV